jgi:hypothetical protein
MKTIISIEQMVRVKREMKLVEEHHISCKYNDLRNSDAVSQHRIPAWNSTTLHLLEQLAQTLHGHVQDQQRQQPARHNCDAELTRLDRNIRPLHPRGQIL